MIYLSINRKDIKFISLAKTLLNQYQISYFNKRYESDFLQKDTLIDIDITASAIKEAITSAKPKPITDKSVCLTLPQSAFLFIRYEVPPDISSTALLAFARDKAKNQLSINPDDYTFDYYLSAQENHQYVMLYGISNTLKGNLIKTFKLIDLSIISIVPDSASIFSLFDKTIKIDKKENILFIHYKPNEAYGYLYDNAGLLNNQQYYLTESIEESLKKTVESLEKENVKVNRLILSGELSDKIRQDLFTKQIGAWTNPLKKILAQFYQENLKMFIIGPENKLPVLEYDVCFGAFLFSQKYPKFNLLKEPKNKNTKISLSLQNPLKKINSLHIIIFFISFFLTFGAIFSINPTIKNKLPNIAFIKPTATPTPSPIQTPTPTPSVPKENIKIRVLNGSGIAGKAAEFKKILEEKGYKEIITGNADNYDYKNTQISYKEEIKSIIESLKQDLKNIVPEASYRATKQPSAADLIIILGSDFK